MCQIEKMYETSYDFMEHKKLYYPIYNMILSQCYFPYPQMV